MRWMLPYHRFEVDGQLRAEKYSVERKCRAKLDRLSPLRICVNWCSSKVPIKTDESLADTIYVDLVEEQ